MQQPLEKELLEKLQKVPTQTNSQFKKINNENNTHSIIKPSIYNQKKTNKFKF